MREIKFRAWQRLFKEMIPVFSIDFENQMINTNGPWRFFNEVELMQYTGLKDKNGVEIYEGDILSNTSRLFTNLGRTPTNKYDTTVREVFWKVDSWSTRIIKSGTMRKNHESFGLEIAAKYGEIIGNIYENPELLEESK